MSGDIYIIECTVNSDDEYGPETYVETEAGYFNDEDKADSWAITAMERENHEKFVKYLKGVREVNETYQVRYDADLKIYNVLKENGVTGTRLNRFEPTSPVQYKAYRFDEWVKMHGVEFSVTRVSKHKED